MKIRGRPARTEALRRHLLRAGPQSAAELGEVLGVSQPTISRHLTELGGEIERIGRGPATRYGWRRPVRGTGWEWPLYRIAPSGEAVWAGTLRALHGGFRIVWTSGKVPAWIPREARREGLFPGLPFFLQDARPQGFLGRALGRAWGDRLLLPSDVRDWTEDDILVFFLVAGDDLAGEWLVGETALQSRARRRTADPDSPEGPGIARYPELARRAEAGEVAGSSAGGEQPKFLTFRRRESGETDSVLVKFTTAEDSIVRRRWADLLLAEHLALRVLEEELGLPVPPSEITEAEGRRFLEVTRFDRVGRAGRRGLLSLGALLDSWISRPNSVESWPEAAEDLVREGCLGAEDAERVGLLWCFGQYLGNTDMHRGNLSFFTDDDGPLRLASAYDMLPMAWAPTRAGSLPREDPPAPAPAPRRISTQRRAEEAARIYWRRLANDPRLSREFREIARRRG